MNYTYGFSTNSGYAPGIPIFLPGEPGVPGLRTDVPENVPIYSKYTGDLIGFGSVPWNTPTDDPTGKNPTYHGGVYYANGPNGPYVMVHQQHSSYGNRY